MEYVERDDLVVLVYLQCTYWYLADAVCRRANLSSQEPGPLPHLTVDINSYALAHASTTGEGS